MFTVYCTVYINYQSVQMWIFIFHILTCSREQSGHCSHQLKKNLNFKNREKYCHMDRLGSKLIQKGLIPSRYWRKTSHL